MPLINPVFVYALVAGFLSFLSPCSFPLLPAYISYFLGGREGSEHRGILREVNFGLFTSMGLATTYLSLGVLASSIGSFLILQPIIVLAAQMRLIWIGLGIILLALGLLLLVKIHFPPLPLPSSRVVMWRGKYLPSYFFGVLYSFTGLGCSLPLFLSVFFLATFSGSFTEGMFIFFTYILGGASPMVFISLATVGVRRTIIRGLQSSVLPHVRRTSSILIIIMGIYFISAFFYPPLIYSFRDLYYPRIPLP